MGRIIYKVGDATTPCTNVGVNVIAHICNNIGGWGRGFVLALSKKWKQPEMLYKQWWSQRAFLKGDKAFDLGNIQEVALDVVNFKPKTYVINMIAQDGIYNDSDGNPPIRYEALKQCLDKLYFFCREEVKKGAIVKNISMPRIGAGLAGGEWSVIEPLIQQYLCDGDNGFDVYIYDLPEEVANNKWAGTKYE